MSSVTASSLSELVLVGIGTGDPQHLTLQAVRALATVDLVLLPCKGEDKAALAELRRAICAELPRATPVPVAEFDLPERDPATPDYRQRVDDWHDAIAAAWLQALAAHPAARRVALLVWGDPSLYDSTLRIAGRLRPAPQVTVIPGITALQALTAAHAIPVNGIGEPFTVTTGRRLREHGWPPGVDTVVVMLDAGGAWQALAPEGIEIWWGACLGLPSQQTVHGPLAEVGPRILEVRDALRARQGWVMDIYLLRRAAR